MLRERVVSAEKVAYLKSKVLLLLWMVFLYPGSLFNVFWEHSTGSRILHVLGIEWVRDHKKGQIVLSAIPFSEQLLVLEFGKCFIENWHYHNTKTLSEHLLSYPKAFWFFSFSFLAVISLMSDSSPLLPPLLFFPWNSKLFSTLGYCFYTKGLLYTVSLDKIPLFQSWGMFLLQS